MTETPTTDALIAEFPGVPQARLRAMNIRLADLARELERALRAWQKWDKDGAGSCRRARKLTEAALRCEGGHTE